MYLLGISAFYHNLISKFKEKTGCSFLVNTSFNVRSEPIICSPTDDYRFFIGTKLNMMTVGNYLLFKKEQNDSLKEKYMFQYKLD